MLHEVLTKRRNELGLSVDELSEKSGVSKSTLAKVLTGVTPNPALETTKSIAYALGMSLDEVVAESDKRLSAAAMRIASIYDSTSDHGRELLDLVSGFIAKNL